MAKKKIVPEEIEEVVEQIEETPVEKKPSKKEEKSQVVLSKEKICEYYGITDKELLSKDVDLSKYNLKEEEAEVLFDWAHQNMIVSADKIKFNIYTCKPEVRAIIEKYGICPKDVANGNLSELTEEEKDIICDYYNELVRSL